jgi:predicted DNA-binding ribbon-helix-helix protein
MSRCDTPESGTVAVVPNQPKTPVRTVRLSDELWERVRAIAAARKMTVSDVLRELLERGMAGQEEDR